MITLTIPHGYVLAGVQVTLIDTDHALNSITLRTDTEGSGAYLRLELDHGAQGLALTVEELEALAALGRQLVAMVDGEELKAPTPGGLDPAAAITPTADN